MPALETTRKLVMAVGEVVFGVSLSTRSLSVLAAVRDPHALIGRLVRLLHSCSVWIIRRFHALDSRLVEGQARNESRAPAEIVRLPQIIMMEEKELRKARGLGLRCLWKGATASC